MGDFLKSYRNWRRLCLESKYSTRGSEKHWFADNIETYVIEVNGQILGTYIIKPNHIDLGNHIGTCSYMVKPDKQGKGIGKKLCEHSLQIAKEIGYVGIQFNIVVSTNIGAIE